MDGNPEPRRGEIWLANHSPTEGREQHGDRPCLVVSHDLFNSGPAELVIACPMTTTHRRIRWHVRVDLPEAGVDRVGYIMCENVCVMSKTRFRRMVGTVEVSTMGLVEERLRNLLDL